MPAKVRLFFGIAKHLSEITPKKETISVQRTILHFADKQSPKDKVRKAFVYIIIFY